jgi:hypothetical protein
MRMPKATSNEAAAKSGGKGKTVATTMKPVFGSAAKKGARKSLRRAGRR